MIQEAAPVALVAVGKLGNSSLLAAELRERERPGVRRQLSELVIHSS